MMHGMTWMPRVVLMLMLRGAPRLLLWRMPMLLLLLLLLRLLHALLGQRLELLGVQHWRWRRGPPGLSGAVLGRCGGLLDLGSLLDPVLLGLLLVGLAGLWLLTRMLQRSLSLLVPAGEGVVSVPRVVL